MPRIRLQPPFQPGASPSGLTNRFAIKQETKSAFSFRVTFVRFLVYNNVGIIKSHDSEAEKSIDVEFHDIATHHALHFANTDNLSMAALSSTVLAMASTGGH